MRIFKFIAGIFYSEFLHFSILQAAAWIKKAFFFLIFLY